MIRFIRSHITNSAENKAEDLTDFFSYSKIATHGFPQRPSCIAVDGELGLLAIGTRNGKIKIVGGEGIEWSTTIESGIPIAHIFFAIGSGVLIALCDDPRTGTQSFHRCQIVNDQLILSRFNQEKQIKHITCCQMLNRKDQNPALLIGTLSGDVYALWIQNLELVPYVIFTESSLKNVNGINKNKSVDKISIHPNDSEKLFLLFNYNIIVLYNTLQNSCEFIYRLISPITDFTCSTNKQKIYISTVNGSYLSWKLDVKPTIDNVKTMSFFNSVNCTNILKIQCTKTLDNDDLVAFIGGVPKETYEDRYTLTLYCKKLVVLDFESPIIDFVFLEDEKANGSALFVLCEQELVVLDIQHPDWVPFPTLLHFNLLHSSPITFTTISSRLSPTAFSRLCDWADRKDNEQNKKKVSFRSWPLKCGSNFAAQNKIRNLNSYDITLLITGHENGCVNIWLTNTLSLKPWLSCNTALEFDGFSNSEFCTDFVYAQELSSIDPENLPLRKCGSFDSFCDDYRLAVTKIVFDSETGYLMVGGRAGQVLLFESSNVYEITLPSPKPIIVDMILNETNLTSKVDFKKNVRNKDTVLCPRKNFHNPYLNDGFVLPYQKFIQFIPTVPVTSIAFLSRKLLVAVGNEFGYSICSLISGEVLVKNCLLSSNEVLQISSCDGTLSRFKSVKKSIRQSFRRKKRKLINQNDLTHNSTLSMIEECRPVEREIVQRTTNSNVFNGETPHSLIKTLYFCNCTLGKNATSSTHLFVGTYGSTVLVHLILVDDVKYKSCSFNDENYENEQNLIELNKKATSSHVKCLLVKEIYLKHGAPIVSIECIKDLLSSRLIVITEEQIRAFMLPSLKSSRYKYRFTAVEGSRIRKANTIFLKSSKLKNSKLVESFIGLITNNGEVYVLSLQNPRRNIHVPFTRASDAAGIASSVLSLDGDLFYLRAGGSELQRASIATTPHYNAPSPFQDEQFRLSAI